MSQSSLTEPVRSLLVPTDFSAGADAALAWARHLALAHGAKITVLHVANVSERSDLPRALCDQIDRSLSSIRAVATEAGIPTSASWEVGRPWKTLVERAREHDAIVIGARGHSPLVRPLGSTADRVVRASAVPVLTVHDIDEPGAPGPRRVLAPCDLSEPAEAAILAAIRLFGRESELEVTLLYARSILVEQEYAFAPVPPLGALVGSDEHAEEALESIAETIRTDGVVVTPVVRHGYPAKVIGDEAKAIDAQVIAIGTQGRSGLERFMLGSVAERVIHGARCPVLSVGHSAVGAVD